MRQLPTPGALMLGVLLAAALPACSRQEAGSPGNPPTGTRPTTTPDTGGTGTARTLGPPPPAVTPSPADAEAGTGASPANAGPGSGAGNSESGSSGGTAATQGTQPMAPASNNPASASPAATPGTSTPPRDPARR